MDEKLKKRLEFLLALARIDFGNNMNYIEFSNIFFGPDGVICRNRNYDRSTIKQITNSPEFEKIQNIKFSLKEQQDPKSEISKKDRLIMQIINH